MWDDKKRNRLIKLNKKGDKITEEEQLEVAALGEERHQYKIIEAFEQAKREAVALGYSEFA